VTSVYLRGIDNTEIIDTVHERRAPMMSASAGLRIGPIVARAAPGRRARARIAPVGAAM
jgi:hypothetical protein